MSFVRRPNDDATRRSVSSASICVLTRLAGDHLLRIQLGQQAAHHRRLARADIAGDDDEALVLVHAVLEIGHRAPVLPAAEVERRIGIELKGLVGEPVEGFVHAVGLKGMD